MEEGKVLLPNVGVCLEKLRNYITITKDGGKASSEDFVKADQALQYLDFLFCGKSEWNWGGCGIERPVIP